MKRNRKLWASVILGLVAVFVALAGMKASQIVTMVKAAESMKPPPEAVTTAEVAAAEWEGSRGAIGTLVAVRGVTLGAEVTGTVRQIAFESGSNVKKGAVLVRLDTSTEEAQLAAAEADASLARITAERARRLRAGEANAQADLDAAEARAKQAAAAVANLRAIIAKKTIRAPFDGRVAIRQVELGQVVAPGAPLASLQSVTPIHADFWVPQQALADVRPGQRARVRTDTYPDSQWTGEVTTINPEVDPATRNVRVRATLPNADGRLRPGMFANVEVLSEQRRSVVTLPATAVMFAPYGDSVFTVEQKQTPGGQPATVVKQKFVRIGERRGDFVAVTSGVAPGETVVSTGAFKLRNGAPVVVDNKLAPEARLAPKPSDD